MKIRHLAIRNFRGIRELDWSVPDRATFCLIGPGDSTKSTVLVALRYVFFPQWNLMFDDADLYQCAPENAITIEVVVGDIPDAFRDLASYGDRLCGWDPHTRVRHDDPGEGREDALRVRLKVGADLEPTWRVIKADGDEGAIFKVPDRAKVAATLIGVSTDRDLTWSRGTLLSRLTEGGSVPSSMAEASRAARTTIESHRSENLVRFDDVARSAELTARSLGVHVAASYKAQLDADAINVRTAGLALHDGNVPVRQLGVGSKRMLITGLQQQNLSAPHITLFDEVEIGLEPHRIARLLHHIKQDTTGQYFLTTHSPVVLRELTINDLHVVHSANGKTEILSANKPELGDSMQGNIRASAEAFLASRIIVCEGATEVGFLRGMDAYWISKSKASLAYQGVAMLDANGASKIKSVAQGLRELAYDVSVLADSDAQQQFSDADIASLRDNGIVVGVWNDALSIEGRVFADLPWRAVLASFELACNLPEHQDRRVDEVQTQYGSRLQPDHHRWTDDPRLRSAIGKAAKIGGWFKRQSLAQQWVAAIAGDLDDESIRETDLLLKLGALRAWIDRA